MKKIENFLNSSELKYLTFVTEKGTEHNFLNSKKKVLFNQVITENTIYLENLPEFFDKLHTICVTANFYIENESDMEQVGEIFKLDVRLIEKVFKKFKTFSKSERVPILETIADAVQNYFIQNYEFCKKYNLNFDDNCKEEEKKGNFLTLLIKAQGSSIGEKYSEKTINYIIYLYSQCINVGLTTSYEKLINFLHFLRMECMGVLYQKDSKKKKDSQKVFDIILFNQQYDYSELWLNTISKGLKFDNTGNVKVFHALDLCFGGVAKKNFELGFSMIEELAFVSKNYKAYEFLYSFYEKGIENIKANQNKALKYAEYAAFLGNDKIAYDLYLKYTNIVIKEKNKNQLDEYELKAFEFLKLSARDNENLSARLALAFIYLQGGLYNNNIKQNIELGTKYLMSAAYLGCAESLEYFCLFKEFGYINSEHVALNNLYKIIKMNEDGVILESGDESHGGIVFSRPIFYKDAKKKHLDLIHEIGKVIKKPFFINNIVTFPKKHSNSYSRIETLSANGESEVVEFKSSLNWCYDNSRKNKGLSFPIIKSIAAFMNSSGGALIIGVKEDENLNPVFIGLENDFSLLRKKNNDGFEIRLIELIRKHLKSEDDIPNHYNIEFESIDNNEVCLINITKSKKPVFVHFDYEKEKHNGTYFRRDGRNSIPLTPEEMFKHIQSKNNL